MVSMAPPVGQQRYDKQLDDGGGGSGHYAGPSDIEGGTDHSMRPGQWGPYSLDSSTNPVPYIRHPVDHNPVHNGGIAYYNPSIPQISVYPYQNFRFPMSNPYFPNASSASAVVSFPPRYIYNSDTSTFPVSVKENDVPISSSTTTTTVPSRDPSLDPISTMNLDFLSSNASETLNHAPHSSLQPVMNYANYNTNPTDPIFSLNDSLPSFEATMSSTTAQTTNNDPDSDQYQPLPSLILKSDPYTQDYPLFGQTNLSPFAYSDSPYTQNTASRFTTIEPSPFVANDSSSRSVRNSKVLIRHQYTDS
ncbi:hypothetical protein CPB86DRAFT_365199 [Serendipita vermifera]|nr:hypothetical protein CPB86DRAFT_365199 [Serendipita vermifera]